MSVLQPGMRDSRYNLIAVITLNVLIAVVVEVVVIVVVVVVVVLVVVEVVIPLNVLIAVITLNVCAGAWYARRMRAASSTLVATMRQPQLLLTRTKVAVVMNYCSC